MPNETLIFTHECVLYAHTKDASIRKIQITKPIPVFNHVCAALCMRREHLAQADGCKFNARRNKYYCSTQDVQCTMEHVYLLFDVFIVDADAALSLVADKMLTKRTTVSASEYV